MVDAIIGVSTYELVCSLQHFYPQEGGFVIFEKQKEKEFHLRANRVHPNTPVRTLDRGGLGEPDHAMLGGHVGRDGARPVEPKDAREVDDAAAVGDGRELVLEAEEDARQVDAEDLVPLVEVDRGDGTDLGDDS